jgi:hypothetical protein
MFAFLRYLRLIPKRRPTARPVQRKARLGLERLDDRLVPSFGVPGFAPLSAASNSGLTAIPVGGDGQRVQTGSYSFQENASGSTDGGLGFTLSESARPPSASSAPARPTPRTTPPPPAARKLSPPR